MNSSDFISESPEETIRWGQELARRLMPPQVVLLAGELGAGKTTLAKGIISGLGVAREDDVTSPTFTLVHHFSNQAGPKVYHVDLYRISGPHDLETLGLEDLFQEKAIILVEWPERLLLRTDWPVLLVELEHCEADCRHIKLSSAPGASAPRWRYSAVAPPPSRLMLYCSIFL